MINLGAALAGGGGARRPNDFYPTPWEATVALLKEVKFPHLIWEPACGDGAMSEVLNMWGYTTHSSDIEDRGFGAVKDFLKTEAPPYGDYFAIVTNPPFNLARQFIIHAQKLTPIVAMLLKSQFWHAASRLPLYGKHPPSRVLPLTWRLDFTGGGAPTMDCLWCVWGVDGEPYKPLPKPAPHEHPAFQ